MADYSNHKFEITILRPYLFKLTPFGDVEIGAEDVYEMRKVFLRFSDDQPFAVLLDASNNFTPTEEARALLASKEFTSKRIAAAFVTTSLANKLIGNFFINFNRPATPTRMFTDEAAALAWLQEQMEKKNKKAS